MNVNFRVEVMFDQRKKTTEAKRTGQILRIQEENDEWLLMFDYIARIGNSTSPSTCD